VIGRIYKRAGQPLTEASLKAFKEYEERRPKGHWGSYEYTAEQYGLSLEDIDQRFATYRKRFINN
jgi:hypothetical protein